MAFPILVAKSFPPDEFQISLDTHAGNSGGSGDSESGVLEEEHLEIDKEISPNSTMLQNLPSLKPQKLQLFTWWSPTGTSNAFLTG